MVTEKSKTEKESARHVPVEALAMRNFNIIEYCKKIIDGNVNVFLDGEQLTIYANGEIKNLEKAKIRIVEALKDRNLQNAITRLKFYK